MKYNIRQNWLSTVEMMVKHPVVIMPFFFVAFLEGLTLEILYFSPRNPILLVAGPIIKKFFGAGFLHYPANFVLLPKLFYYCQIPVYIIAGVFLSAISVNIYKNIGEGLPVRTRALINNAFKRYASFIMYGVVMIVMLMIMQKGGSFVFSKFVRVVTGHFKQFPPVFLGTIFLGGHFLMNIILQVFLVLTVPLIVIEKKSFIHAIFGSILLGFRNFFKIFTVIFLPYLIYLPVFLLRTAPAKLINNTFPGITVIIVAAGIIITPFLDCFIILCASRFLLDKQKVMEKTI